MTSISPGDLARVHGGASLPQRPGSKGATDAKTGELLQRSAGTALNVVPALKLGLAGGDAYRNYSAARDQGKGFGDSLLAGAREFQRSYTQGPSSENLNVLRTLPTQ